MPNEPIISDERDEHPRSLDFLVAPYVGAAMGKKDEPLSAIGTKSVRIMDRGVPILSTLLSSPTSAPARGASPTPSVEEVPPRNKRLRAGEK